MGPVAARPDLDLAAAIRYWRLPLTGPSAITASASGAFCRRACPLSRDGVTAHVAALHHAGRGTPERRLTLAAIRKLAREMQARGLITPSRL